MYKLLLIIFIISVLVYLLLSNNRNYSENYINYNYLGATNKENSSVLNMVSYDGLDSDGLKNKLSSSSMYDRRNPSFKHLQNKSIPQINTFGSASPLKSEEHSTESIDNPLTPFINRKASPMCCTNTLLSSHSTSTGCICPE